MKASVMFACIAVLHLVFTPFSHADCPEACFTEVIEKETKTILLSKNATHLADAYASRGESYLLMHCFDLALDDFSMAYTYASTLDDENGKLGVLRALMDSFFVYALIDDTENAQMLFDTISPLIKAQSCCAQQDLIHPCSYREEPNYPILGPDHININECLKRVEVTAKELQLLCAAIPNTQVRVLAVAY